MHALLEQRIHCPYCGEAIDILVDNSEPWQSYIEDCQVCCRPIQLSVSVDEHGGVAVTAQDENETHG